MKILITGGGTGGHLYPALAVADALKAMNPALEVLFVGSERGMEKEQVPEAGYAFRALDVRGFPRRGGLGSLQAAWSFGKAILAARKLVRAEAPEVVFSTGGYASAAVVVGAWLEKVPIVLQEQNSVPGMTNRIAARMAEEVHVAFASARKYFPKRRHLRLTGNPLRGQVLQGSHSRALRLFRLDEGRTTVVVLGGSQGAHSINQAIEQAMPFFAGREDIQFLVQTGNLDHDQVLEACRTANVKTWVRRFIANMGDAYAIADLVVCRAGAMTLSELAACGLPAILVPYPHATGDHQWINAEQMGEAGAAVLLRDRDLTGALLAEQVNELLRDRKRLREMSINALRMARPDATEKLCNSLARYLPGLEPPVSPETPRGRARPRPAARVGPSVRGPESRAEQPARRPGQGPRPDGDRRDRRPPREGRNSGRRPGRNRPEGARPRGGDGMGGDTPREPLKARSAGGVD